MSGRKPPTWILPDGLPRPRSNWFRTPNVLTLIVADLAREQSYAEIIVLLYILRHTWGYNEYDKLKHITLDEFVTGRAHADPDRTRIDNGTGLTRRAVQLALRRLETRQVLEVFTDDEDPGRIRKLYRLRIKP